jgi:hypothetical protein
MTMTPQDFVSKWKRAEARERQSVQEHFISPHKCHDEAVFATYDWSLNLSDEEVSGRMLKLNLNLERGD